GPLIAPSPSRRRRWNGIARPGVRSLGHGLWEAALAAEATEGPPCGQAEALRTPCAGRCPARARPVTGPSRQRLRRLGRAHRPRRSWLDLLLRRRRARCLVRARADRELR